MCFSSALSITQAVNPPRAVYLDYPLGHTTGKVADPENQTAIMHAALQAFVDIRHPGEISNLDFHWSADDSWKDRVMRPSPAADSADDSAGADDTHKDDRVARLATPQYQTAADAQAADPACPTCVFLES